MIWYDAKCSALGTVHHEAHCFRAHCFSNLARPSRQGVHIWEQMHMQLCWQLKHSSPSGHTLTAAGVKAV